jgi:hypothetical protein
MTESWGEPEKNCEALSATNPQVECQSPDVRDPGTCGETLRSPYTESFVSNFVIGVLMMIEQNTFMFTQPNFRAHAQICKYLLHFSHSLQVT